MLTRPGMVLVGTALLAIITGSASGGDLRVIRSSSEAEVSFDVESIKTVVGSHTEVKVLTIYGETQKLEGVPPFEATVAVLLIRCLTMAGSISKLVFLSTSDKPVAQFNYPVQWKPVDPKTDVGIVWEYVCTRGWERDKQ
jgi:hypothetical protein